MSFTLAIVGSGALGAFVIDEFLAYKAAGSVTTLKIISRSVSLFLLDLSPRSTDASSPTRLPN